MAETNTTSQASAEHKVEKLNRFKQFTTNHPRTTKVVGALAGAATVVGTVVFVANRANGEQTDQAPDASEALPSSHPVTKTD